MHEHRDETILPDIEVPTWLAGTPEPRSGAMRPAFGAPVQRQAVQPLTLRRVVRGIGTTLLMLCSYGAIVASLTVFFSGVYLAAADYLTPSGAEQAKVQPWQATLAEHDPISAEFEAYRQQVSGGFGGYQRVR